MTQSPITRHLPVLEPYEFVAEPDLNARCLDAEQGHHLRYVVGTAGRPPIVHPGLLLNYSNRTKSPTFSVGANEAGVHSRDETRFINPAFVGSRLRVTWNPAELIEKRGRIFHVIDTLVTDQDGREILRRRATSTSTSDTQPIGRQGEQPARRNEPEPPPSGPAPLGLVLAGRPKSVTLERMRLFSGWPVKNIHTDEDTARTAGCPAPIASATQNMGHICELMLDNFGDDWLRTGTLSVVFVRPIYAGDTVTCRAVIRSLEPDGGRTRYTLDVSAENQHGEAVTVGRATGVGP
jgi:acyl dehydratase